MSGYHTVLISCLKLWERRTTAKKVTLILAAGFGIRYLIGQLLAWRRRLLLARKRIKKRQECQKSLEQLRRSIPNSKEAVENQAKILKMSVTDLLQQLREDRLKPTDVLEAYQSAALKAHRETNCLIEPIKEASIWAKQLESKPKGLLYGLPVAMKDDHGIKDYDSSLGCASLTGKPCQDDCVVVKALKAEGAIPFVKTNVAQGVLSYESSNPIFGIVRNPHNSERGAGGSSGGTGALVSAGGALVGGGSDLGGSIRVPAALNGVYGFKPTSRRISSKGCAYLYKTHDMVPWAYGPISRDMTGVLLYMKALWSGTMFKEDPIVSTLPFQDQIFSSQTPLRIGYFVETADVALPPACKRAILIAKKALECCGHTVVKFNIKNSAAFVKYKNYAIRGDGGKRFTESLIDDVVDQAAYSPANKSQNVPRTLRKLIVYILKTCFGRTIPSLTLSANNGVVDDWWDEINEKQKLLVETYEDWNNMKLDGILCPATAFPALPLGSISSLTGGSVYPAIFNVLDCPAGVVPVTTVTKEDEENLKSYPENNDFERITKERLQNSIGLPICVQCAALPYRDEVCLRLMTDIDNNLQ